MKRIPDYWQLGIGQALVGNPSPLLFMITSPVITSAGGTNHHIEVLAVIPANVPDSMTAAVWALSTAWPTVVPSWLCRLACFSQLAPSSPARRIAAVTRLPRAAPL
jgi:hypothetical protein